MTTVSLQTTEPLDNSSLWATGDATYGTYIAFDGTHAISIPNNGAYNTETWSVSFAIRTTQTAASKVVSQRQSSGGFKIPIEAELNVSTPHTGQIDGFIYDNTNADRVFSWDGQRRCMAQDCNYTHRADALENLCGWSPCTDSCGHHNGWRNPNTIDLHLGCEADGGGTALATWPTLICGAVR